MTAIRAFNKERDAMLRSLDRGQLDRFLRKWKQPRPRKWVDDAWLGAMHKARLQIASFTEAEKAVSRTWLAQHGYSEEIKRDRPCPNCGGIGASHSDCFVCGMAT